MYKWPRVKVKLNEVQLKRVRAAFHKLPLFYLRAYKLRWSGIPPKSHGGLQSYEQTDALTPKIVGSCCVRVGSDVQTDGTTLKNVGTCSALWEGYNS